MKKLTRYLQKQALQYSDEKYSSAAYLSPRRNHEPQEKLKHHLKTTSSDNNNHLRPKMPPNRKPSNRGAAIPSRISSNIQRVQYASENILQSYELFIPPPPASESDSAIPPPYSEKHPSTPSFPIKRLWIIFIHGGYFRDPSILASSFHATLSLLTDPNSPDQQILALQRHTAGYVSINYRLAPHEAHPQDPTTTPSYEMRNARWPEILGDVLNALRHFQAKHPSTRPGGDEGYVLVGHSVGATLAMNALLHMQNQEGIAPPVGIVGVSGIYDFIRLHETFPGYDAMTRNAVDEEDWEGISVARKRRGEIEAAWAAAGGEGGGKENKRWLLLAHSKEDTLVDWGQLEAMANVFKMDSSKDGPAAVTVKCDVEEIKGKHNACWEDGRELARVIERCVGEIVGV
ncbi:Kynurenine formamidase [Cyphellophora attinorum]|uniref:Kynurenine formamidase n=1 Tax=Cyphellophora attinorum TaxID=1664694 RepID=A0A0N0NIT5_9EURO|nr:Kynurenine formamidase [Phialophora attinorum]KPI36201.1 Kynurenine formamidase [Phialophora attinorum]